ncbi:hypothetical protein D9M69_670520 [compost metagenome]
MLPPMRSASSGNAGACTPRVPVRSGATLTSSHAVRRPRDRNPAETSRRLAVPSGSASCEVSQGPTIAPSVPPMEISAKKRPPWSLVKRSDINAQNTMMANRLNTLNHT